jgi:hypothetical protein
MVYESIRDIRECYLNVIPFVQARVVMVSTMLSVWSSFRWPDHRRGPVESTYFMFIIMVGYMLVGMLFAWRATHRFRRDIF